LYWEQSFLLFIDGDQEEKFFTQNSGKEKKEGRKKKEAEFAFKCVDTL